MPISPHVFSRSKRIAAGFLIRSKGLYLLCHTTQDPDYVYSDEDPFWSVPKGEVNPGEGAWECALRETKEETNLNLEEFFKFRKTPLFLTYETKQKFNYIYFVDEPDGKLLSFNFKCTSLIDNKRYPVRNGLPEHDMFKWASKEDAVKLVSPSLATIFDMEPYTT